MASSDTTAERSQYCGSLVSKRYTREAHIEIEQFDHYKNDAISLPPYTQIEVDGERYTVTTGGKAYSPRLRLFLSQLIYTYDFNILWHPNRPIEG